MDKTLQPVTHTTDGYFNTTSKSRISLHNPVAEQITVEDIACALSKICRFGGNIPYFYSVAQHSLLVTHLAPSSLKKAALMHDAPEAYIGDVIKPLKHLIEPLYRPIEEKFEEIIFQKFGVSTDLLPEIKRYDLEALEIEHNFFRGLNLTIFQRKMIQLEEPQTRQFCWSPGYAYHRFMLEYKRLFIPPG